MSITKPIIKWVGGKSQILETLLPLFPKNIKDYHEIFIGGGSVLLGLLSYVKEGKINLSGKMYAYDINETLVNVYRNIQSNHNELYEEIIKIINEYNSLDNNDDKSSYYYSIRDRYNTMERLEKNSPIGSAYFIFLNKTGFRGLYRVNSKGGYNVPYGNYKNPEIINREHLNEVHALIQGVIFEHLSYEISLGKSFEKGDFIYMDPPYAPENESSFVSYSETGFSIEEHKRLFKICGDLKVKFIMSNADVEFVRKYFPKDEGNFIINRIECKRSINSKNPGAKTGELLIENPFI